MTKDILLKSTTRGQSEKAKKVRDEGAIPVVLYGPSSKNKSLKVSRSEFEKTYLQAGESNIFDLVIDDEKSVKVVIKNIEKDPVKRNIIHADLYQVDMKKEITAEIPLIFTGDSKLVAEEGGTLVKYFDRIEVECLPSKLPDHIDVDISVLKSFEDHIRVADLSIPDGIRFVNSGEEIVASIAEVKIESEPSTEPSEAVMPETEVKKEEAPK